MEVYSENPKLELKVESLEELEKITHYEDRYFKIVASTIYQNLEFISTLLNTSIKDFF